MVHAAGVLDDGVIGSLTPARVEAVLRPKADAAWYLHELTRELDLARSCCSPRSRRSFGRRGQGNYAAANTFLDALAAVRRAAGLAGCRWRGGLWAAAAGMTGRLDAADLGRMARGGITRAG